MSEQPLCITDDNLSLAWGRVLLETLGRKGKEVTSLVVTVTGFDDGVPKENELIRSTLDEVLKRAGKRPVGTVANTIFPTHIWKRTANRQELYQKYLKILPELKHRPANRRGVYFGRMLDYGDKHINQLEHIISTRAGGNRRRSALQLCIFDPLKDHTNQRQMGFPCLQHVVFVPHDSGELDVIGLYAMQYILERAYGNYVGLSALGNFVARELGLTLGTMQCVIGVAKLNGTKKALSALAECVTQQITANAEGLSRKEV